VSRRQGKPSVSSVSHRIAAWVAVGAALVIGAAVLIATRGPSDPVHRAIRAQPIRYLGVYEQDAPDSYAGVTAFTASTGVRPDVVLYFSPWRESFQARFAASAAENGAVPLVQIDPSGVDLDKIAAGQYDGYLSAYAESVRSYDHPVILSFGHEMNGNWYSWAYQHTSPATFVAAWRHIVTLFRSLDVRNVIWMWTVNILALGGIPSPGPWWPGGSYVNWVGIDGYYYQPSWTFASLFGPTIAAVRGLTHDPILIAETGAAPADGQPAKIANLFAGVRLYGLSGFVWFDVHDWRITSPSAVAAFRRGARIYQRPAQ
jgi:mannan endo-1,4-beta-mannosidase